MTRPYSLAVEPSSAVDSSRPPLASWYTEGSSDGIGDRLLMFDNAGTPSLELLRFRPQLAAVIGFEDALRQRVDRLQQFVHPAFPTVRAVDQLDDRGSLALVSTFTAGKRLAEVFRSSHTRSGVHPAFAAWLIRDLTAALADLQRHDRGISHGALTPDRIVLTPDGRLVIVEHVLGAALEQLRLPSIRLWQDLGLIAPQTSSGSASLDCRTDVIQLAWIVLSALLGRRITPAEYPRHIDRLFDEFARTSAERSPAPALVPGLRRWLERALRVNGEVVFESAEEAHQAVRELGVHTGPHAVAFMAGSQPAVPFVHDPPRLAPRGAPHIEPALLGEGEPPAQPLPKRETQPMPVATDYFADFPAKAPPKQPSSLDNIVEPTRRMNSGWVVAAVCAIVAGGEAGLIAHLVSARPAASPAATVSVLFDSADPGTAVIVDGQQVGLTPLELNVAPGMRSIRVEGRPVLPKADAKSVPPVQALVDRPIDTAATVSIAQANARQQRGGLRLTAPIEVQVLEGERVLGSSADGPVVTTAGRHELDFVNNALGYRSRQVVDIKPGQIVKLALSPPEGRVSVNAVPWAQVWINGHLIGETPLANVPLAVGEHQIAFRHPQLGEQTQKVIVRSAALTRVSATFAR